jgi:hypothetical protein
MNCLSGDVLDGGREALVREVVENCIVELMIVLSLINSEADISVFSKKSAIK